MLGQDLDSKIAASSLISLRSHPPKLLPRTQGNINEESLVPRDLQQNVKRERNIITPPTNPTTPTSTNVLGDDFTSTNCRSDRLEATVDTHNFLIMLMSLLSDDAYQDQLSFLADGTSFVIKHKTFSRSLMPRYFNLSTFSEFMRVLKRLSFTEVKNPTISDSYILLFHPYFQKGNKDTIRNIRFLSKASHCRRKKISTFLQSINNDRYTSKGTFFNDQEDSLSSSRGQIDDPPSASTHELIYQNRITANRSPPLSTSETYPKMSHSKKSNINTVASPSSSAIDKLLRNVEPVKNQQYTSTLVICDQIDDSPSGLTQVPLCHDIVTANQTAPLTHSGACTKNNFTRDVLTAANQCLLNDHNMNRIHKCATIPIHLSDSFDATNRMTRKVVAAAVQCLLDDEDHTLNLLSRRGHELKKRNTF